MMLLILKSREGHAMKLCFGGGTTRMSQGCFCWEHVFNYGTDRFRVTMMRPEMNMTVGFRVGMNEVRLGGNHMRERGVPEAERASALREAKKG